MKYKTPISVVMPCYHKANIQSAIQSILNQSFEKFELIIIDDSYHMETEYEIAKINDSRIVYVRNAKNDSAKNLGISIATGKYICMADSDDIALPYRLEFQYKYLESYLHVGCLGGASEVINDNGISTVDIKKPLDYPQIKAQLLRDCCIARSTVIFRSYLLKKYQLFYNDRFKQATDYDFFVRASSKFPIRNVAKVLVQRKQRQGQILADKSLEKVKFENNVRRCQLKAFGVVSNRYEEELHLKLMRGEYINDTDLKKGEAWLNKLLAANCKNKQYNNNYLFQLFQNVLNVAVYNNSLGGWSIEKEMLEFIEASIENGESILEFGSGKGTEALLGCYTVTSVEHDEKFFVRRAKNHKIILAPIKNSWYNRDPIKSIMKQRYDLIIVDGPPRRLRAGILDNLDLFEGISTPIIFDDVNRQLDRNVMEKFCSELNFQSEVIIGRKKEFAICTKSNSK